MLLPIKELKIGGSMKNKTLIIGIIGFLLLIQPMGAQTWTASKRLTYNSGGSWFPAIAADSNDHIHLVWEDLTPGNYEIIYKKSTDEGATWTTKRLTYNSGGSRLPAIATDSNNHLHLAWHDMTPGNDEIYYKRSSDGGATWTTKRLTYNSGSSTTPSITTNANNHLHLVWVDKTPGNNELYYKRSTDGGVSWTTKRLTFNSGDSYAPSIAVDSNNHIHVVWSDSSPATSSIFYKKSTDGGVTWTTKRLTWGSISSYSPEIAIDSTNRLHIVWDGYDPIWGYYDIYYKRSTDAGATWGGTKWLTLTLGDTDTPKLAVDSNDNVHVVWDDNDFGDYEIYYRRSTNGGTTWKTKRLTYNSADTHYPALATDTNNRIHVVWQHYISMDWELYYKKGIQ
jgi:hypothetical protein